MYKRCIYDKTGLEPRRLFTLVNSMINGRLSFWCSINRKDISSLLKILLNYCTWRLLVTKVMGLVVRTFLTKKYILCSLRISRSCSRLEKNRKSIFHSTMKRWCRKRWSKIKPGKKPRSRTEGVDSIKMMMTDLSIYLLANTISNSMIIITLYQIRIAIRTSRIKLIPTWRIF